MEPEELLSELGLPDPDVDPVEAIEEVLESVPDEPGSTEKLAYLGHLSVHLARAPLGALDVFAPRIRTKLGFTKEVLTESVHKARRSSRERSVASTPADKEPTPEELERAHALVQDPAIEERFVEDMAQLGVVGETLNVLLLLLAVVSRLLARPISLVFKGASSVGKSFLPTIVLSTLPSREYFVFTAASEKALYHRTDSLAHKVIAFMERPGAEDSDYQIRVLQSEGRLVYSVAEKDPETGQIVTVDKEIEGPIAYIETTTKASLHDENETRLFSASLDETEQATRSILLEQGRRASGQVRVDGDSIRRVWQAVHTLLQVVEVVTPFAWVIPKHFPSGQVRARRDFPRFLSLIEAAAVLRQHQRDRDAAGKIIATLDDYALARRLATPLLETALRGVTAKTLVLVAAARGFATEEDSEKPESVELSAAKLIKRLPKSGWSKSTVRRHMGAAEEAGYLDAVAKKRGEAAVYRLASIHQETAAALPTVEELAAEIEATGVVQPRQGASNADDAPKSQKQQEIAGVRQLSQGGQREIPFEDAPPPSGIPIYEASNHKD